jgi:hypothetical protein
LNSLSGGAYSRSVLLSGNSADHVAMMHDLRSWRRVILSIGIAYLVPVAPSMAQQESSPPAPVPLVPSASASAPQQGSPPVDAAPDAQKKKNPDQAGSDDRLFWTLPNFLTVENAEQVTPLTRRQKFDVVARSTFDPVEFGWYGFLTSVSQAEGGEPGYGPGAAGFAKRYGSEFADGTIDNFMVGAIVPALLHQDPRYYQLGHGGFWHRAGYSVSRLFVTRADSGKIQFNYSEILGSLATAGVSTAYHPAGDRTVANASSVWWSQVGYDGVSALMKEFWPDIRRKFGRH